MPSSHHDTSQQQPHQLYMPPPLPVRQRPHRPSSVPSTTPPQRPPPRCRRPKSDCTAPPSRKPSLAITPNFDHCPVTKRPTLSFADTKLRIPDARQRLTYLENQCKCYVKADSEMAKWIKRVSTKGPPMPMLEGYISSRRQSHSSFDSSSSQDRNSASSSSSGPQPSPSFSTTLTTFLRKAAGGSISSSTRQSQNTISETPRPSLSRMFRHSSIGRISMSISTKTKGNVTREKITTKISPPLSPAAAAAAAAAAASPPLYAKPDSSSISKEQQQQHPSSKRWRSGSVMGSLRIPSSSKSENTRRQVALATVVDCRVLPMETKTTDWRRAKKVAENSSSSSQSLAQRKRTVAPSLAPMYISAAWR